MEFLNLINGDNLFKYCFTLGLVMVVFALVYPLEKEHQIQLEIISYHKEEEILNKDIRELDEWLTIIEKEREFLKKQAKVVKENQKVDKEDLKRRLEKAKIDLQGAQKLERDLETKVILLNYNKNRINVLNKQATTFSHYSRWLIFFGIIFIVFGFTFWAIHTFKEMKKKPTEKK